MLKLSLIIPVYNEERHIKSCLEAVAKQTVMPYEVIVVDNNCSDNTIKIAKTFSFVKIISENRQGRGYARTAGFNVAKGDIIGRTDADSQISIKWVQHVIKRFTKDNSLDGLTGLGRAVFLPGINGLKSKISTRCYYWFVHAGFNTVTMWGANMALRRSAWQQVRDDVCLDDDKVHEDQDVSLWIAAKGGKIQQDNDLLVTISGQSYRYLPKLLRYYALYRSTKRIHKKNGNLNSKKLRKIGFLRTLSGRFMIIIPGILFFFVSILLFPIDYLVQRYSNNSKWLD
jgi:cellulose synthase/poly-beta-1,6-N-acetylglucosamine synthase-like glycosyltransferase